MQIENLQKLCKAIVELKEQFVDELPHLGHTGLFFHSDEITTGLMHNKVEIKINLLTGKLNYYNNEDNQIIDITSDGKIFEKLQAIGEELNARLPTKDFPETQIDKVSEEEFSAFHKFAAKANKSLELFRTRLSGKFTLVHLWPHHFDFSVQWFTGNKDEQIETGISPGDEQYPEPYIYMNPWPFNEKVTEKRLPIGIWHTENWKGIKVEWKDLEKLSEQKIEEKICELFEVAKKNFE